MRKWLLPIALCGLLLLTSCGQNEQGEETTDWTPLQIAQAVLDSQSELPSMTAILPGNELYASYIDSYYWFDMADIADGAIFCADTASAQEIAVLRLADGADIDEAKQIFSDYSQRRSGSFAGYLPDEAALAENASIAAQGDIVVLLICREPDLAEAAFQRAFTEAPPDDSAETVNQLSNNDAESIGNPDDNAEGKILGSGLSESGTIPQASENDTVIPPEPESEAISTDAGDFGPVPSPANTDELEPKYNQTDTYSEPITPSQPEKVEDIPWSYDSARLLDAWQRGNWGELPQQDQEILNACQAVIGRTGFGSLSDYEKELAVHDWMLDNGRYDTSRLSNLPQYQENPDNDNPYGFLIGGVGICRGYTATFQLFMDLIGIECISVQGQSNSTRDEHAWNMVRLDGEWYCVDVTWDDPVTDQPVSVQKAHRYFNVTSEFMRSTGHYWDEGSVPKATATSYAWGSGGLGIPT